MDSQAADIQSESDLRKWLRENWPDDHGPLIWVEAARGGTAGAPDVFVPTDRFGYIPVELKYWPREKPMRIKRPMPATPKMRASQRRLHTLMRSFGLKSAVLAYVGFYDYVIVRGDVASQDVGLLPNFRLHPSADPSSGIIAKMFLNKPEFWKGY